MAKCRDRFNAAWVTGETRNGMSSRRFLTVLRDVGTLAAMKLPLCLVVGLVVAGCAGSGPRPPATPVRNAGNGDWFCQMSPTGSGWECVQDPDLAENPRPARLPAGPPPGNGPRPLPQPTPREAPESAPEREEREAPPPPVEPELRSAALQPNAPRSLADLPGDFYTVQLMAMSSAEALEEYVNERGLQGMSAARVERDGRLYYVLLLGIYETADQARNAAAHVPPSLAGATPWVRSLGSLQSAIVRGDALAGAGI